MQAWYLGATWFYSAPALFPQGEPLIHNIVLCYAEHLGGLNTLDASLVSAVFVSLQSFYRTVVLLSSGWQSSVSRGCISQVLQLVTLDWGDSNVSAWLDSCGLIRLKVQLS